MNRIFCFFITLFSLTQVYAIGGTVGNGGYVIKCNSFADYRSLDYVLAKQLFDRSVKVVEVRNSHESLMRISALINAKVPQWAPSFRAYLNDLMNTQDSLKKHFWSRVYFGIKNPTDDQDFRSFPSDCSPSGGVFDYVQVVLRTNYLDENNQPHVVFEYDADYFPNLSPVQDSFIFVHEWLWEISNDVRLNRKINYFLHSQLFETYSPAEVIKQLKQFGAKLK